MERYPAYFFNRDGSLARIENMEQEEALDKSVWKDRAWTPDEIAGAASDEDEPDDEDEDDEDEDEDDDEELGDELPETLDALTVVKAEKVVNRPEVTPAQVKKWLDAETDGKGRLGLLAILRKKLED